MRGKLIGIAALVALTSTAHAQQTLQNDGFVSPMSVGFQAGFGANEIGASRFLAPEAGRRLLNVRFLFGDTAVTRTITLKVYDDTNGTVAPGVELFTGDYDVMGSAMAFHEVDLTADNVILTQQFRVGILFQTGGLPSIARDDDGTIMSDKNYVYGGSPPIIPIGWYRSQDFGLTGDWIIRATISSPGGTPDAAPSPDGNPGTPDASPGTPDANPTAPDAPPNGGVCAGNTECPVGQYCHPTNLICTFDCREDVDCSGGDTCNSLGQCVEGGGGGCGCAAEGNNGVPGGAVLFALGLVTLVVRRRRR